LRSPHTVTRSEIGAHDPSMRSRGHVPPGTVRGRPPSGAVQV